MFQLIHAGIHHINLLCLDVRKFLVVLEGPVVDLVKHFKFVFSQKATLFNYGS